MSLDDRQQPEPKIGQSRRRVGPVSRLKSAVQRCGDGVALAIVIFFYVAWPTLFRSDRGGLGGADDFVFLLALAFLARRVIKHSPTLLGLPATVSRSVRRTLARGR